LAVVHHREVRQFRQIAHEERQQLLFIQPANPAQAFDRVLVVEMTGKRVTGIGRQRDYAAVVDDLHRLFDEARLRIVWMKPKVLGHGG